MWKNSLLAVMFVMFVVMVIGARYFMQPPPVRNFGSTIAEFKADCKGEISADLELSATGDKLRLYCQDYRK